MIHKYFSYDEIHPLSSGRHLIINKKYIIYDVVVGLKYILASFLVIHRINFTCFCTHPHKKISLSIFVALSNLLVWKSLHIIKRGHNLNTYT